MTRQTTAEQVTVWLGRLVGVLAVGYTALGTWVLLGRPTSVGANGYLVGSLVSVLLLLGVAYVLAEQRPALRDGGHSL
ncbi:hypothetical protein [Halorientalis regularis]|jgi:uncharacterized membrane protein|uniref:Uncharacterized protein n=1 Tax=Halorientalis regularis TaxID=660518 RepID=A0A1G7FVD2_9EURY|nr:hypothetical protein [Halorientalis regularis]SDE79849.1 hypothetical protein SAMN05216218_101367 [Halorientalis regularis]